MYHTTVQFTLSDSISNSTAVTVFTSHHILAHYLTVKNSGVYVSHCQYATLLYIAVEYVQESGIFLTNSSHMNFANVRVSKSGLYGLDISYVDHIDFVSTSVTETYQTGVNVIASKNIAFSNVCVVFFGTINFQWNESDTVYTNCFGFDFIDVECAELYNVRVEYSKDDGIVIDSSLNVSIENTTVTNVFAGISSIGSFNISHTTINSSPFALSISDDKHCVIANITIAFTQLQGNVVHVMFSHFVEIKNISLLLTSKVGVLQKEVVVELFSCNEVIVSKSIFANFNTPHTSHFFTEQPAVLLLPFSNHTYFSDCSFVGNNITALKLVNSEFTVWGILNFTHNRAYRGGAIVFTYDSKMKLSNNSSVLFVDNHAIFTGGAIQLATNHYYMESSYFVPFCSHYSQGCHAYTPECFLEPEQYNFRGGLTFVNNTAGQGGDVLYGSVVGYCYYYRDEGKFSIPCSQLFEEISNITPNTSSQVASDPIRVCYCDWGLPDCDMVSIEGDSIFPGQSITVPAIVVGYEGGTVAGLAFANFLPLHSRRSQLEGGENTKKVTQVHCNELEYTIFSTNTADVLVLSTIDQEKSLLVDENSGSTEFPLYVNISLSPCLPGFTLLKDLGRCECSKFLSQLSRVSCNIKKCDHPTQRAGVDRWG